MSDSWITGGKGTGAGAAATNGGGFIDGTAATFDNSQLANGLPLYSLIDCTIDEAVSNNIRVSKSGINWSGVQVGQWVYCDFAATYTDGRYAVISVDTTYMELALSWSANTTATVKVGGALDNPDDALALATAGDVIYLPNNVSSVRTYTLPNNGGNAAMSFVHASGTKTARITMRGCNNDGTDLAVGADRPILTTSVSLTVGMLEFTTYDYYDVIDLIIDCGGAGKADYGLYNSNVLATNNRFFNVKFCNGDVDNIYWLGQYPVFINVEGCGAITRAGATLGCANGAFYNCVFHDNAGDGLALITCNYNLLINTMAYDNGNYGINLAGASSLSRVINCLAYGNALAGIRSRVNTANNVIMNNISVGNGGVGYDLEGDPYDQTYFGYNHSYNNSAHCSECADGAFADFMNGGNITGDPLFASVVDGSEDFTPALTSPLIAAALPNLDLAAVNYQDIGPIQRALTLGSAILHANKTGNKQ
jgi:hypothetical protein